MIPVMQVRGLSKRFVLHQQQGAVLDVLSDVAFEVMPGECLILHGQSGAGKSTLLRTLYGNYLPADGSIRVQHGGAMVEMVGAEPRQTLALRRSTIGYVSQFLRVIPRVSCLDVVIEPALLRNVPAAFARAKAAALLQRLGIPERLWGLSPSTFSGGEQQRVNIARSFIAPWPLLLLDEPTASLDEANRQVVIELVAEAKAGGSALIAISHDETTRKAICDRYLDLTAEDACYA